MLTYISLFFIIAGFIISLGAVTVIDVLGLLARTSGYWTQATIRAHHVTKSLIWVGLPFIIFGSSLFYAGQPFIGIPLLFMSLLVVIFLNGVYLSGVVSPYLQQREKSELADVLLPKEWQRKILVSVIISDIGWWSAVVVFVWSLGTRIL